jgi:hypothetical protein
MIELLPIHLLGKGRTRFCYFHPPDSGKCIKIDKRESGGSTAKEARYYEKLARIRPDLPYVHIPKFHGHVETNLGRGGVFDLIRDETTGEVSKSFGYYIATGEVKEDHPLWIQAHQDYLKVLYHEAVVIRDFNPGNLCARQLKGGGYQLVTIDGIGHSDFFPL